MQSNILKRKLITSKCFFLSRSLTSNSMSRLSPKSQIIISGREFWLQPNMAKTRQDSDFLDIFLQVCTDTDTEQLDFLVIFLQLCTDTVYTNNSNSTHRDYWPCTAAARYRPPPPCRPGARCWSWALILEGHCRLQFLEEYQEKFIFSQQEGEIRMFPPWVQWILGNCKHLLCIDMLILYWLLAWNALLSFISWSKIL